MPRRIPGCIAASLLVAAALSAEVVVDTPPAETARTNTPPRDYSRGFAEFMKLGLPDVSTAQYVTLNWDSGFYSPDFGSEGLNLTGNAWMIEETPKEQGRFVVDQCRIVTVRDRRLAEKEITARIAAAGTNLAVRERVEMSLRRHRTAGDWKKADLARDVGRLLAYLRKEAESKERFSRLQYGNMAPPFFLMAAHVYRRGMTNEANEIVDILFRKAGGTRRVVGGALAHVASKRYEAAYEAFTTNDNWSAFGADLNAILARFGDSWSSAPAVRRLMARVESRAANPEPPPVPGELTDADQQSARDLASLGWMDGNIFGWRQGTWLLPVERQPEYVPAGAEVSNAVTRLCARGLSAVPVLLALLGDEYLVPIDAHGLRNVRYSYSYRYGGEVQAGEGDESVVDKLYESLQRPATRGEIAGALLESIVPKPEEDRRGESEEPEAFRERCQGWYAEIKGKSLVELARHYLKEGDDAQRQSAVLYLLEKGAEADLAAIEAELLESADGDMNMGAIQAYVAERKENALPFLDKLDAQFKSATTSEDPSMFGRIGRNKEYYESQLKALRESVRAKDLAGILAEFAAGQGVWNDLYVALHEGRQPREEQLVQILRAAVQATRPEGRVSLLQATRILGAGRTARTAVETGPLRMAPHVELWKPLLEDARVTGGAGSFGPDTTVGDMAAEAIETLYGPKASGSRQHAWLAPLGLRLAALYRARAEARLAGKPESELPAFPGKDDLTLDQRKAVVAAFMKIPEQGVAEHVTALGDMELLALLGAARRQPPVAGRLQPLALTVQAVHADAPLLDAAGSLMACKGKRLDVKAVEAAVALCRESAVKGRVVCVTFQRQAVADGVRVRAREILPGTDVYGSIMETNRPPVASEPARVTASVSGPEANAGAFWWAEERGGLPRDSSPVPATADDRLLDTAAREIRAALARRVAQDQEMFWETVGKLCSGEGGIAQGVSIEVTGRIARAPTPADPAAVPRPDETPAPAAAGKETDHE